MGSFFSKLFIYDHTNDSQHYDCEAVTIEPAFTLFDDKPDQNDRSHISKDEAHDMNHTLGVSRRANTIVDLIHESETDSSIVESNDLKIDECFRQIPNIPLQSPNNINSVSINNSSHITFGDTVVYNGPVTITQNIVNSNQSNSLDANQKRIADNFRRSVTEHTQSLRFVSRDEWFAKQPQRNLTLLKLPAIRVVIAHTDGKCCMTQMDCVRNVRDFQDLHMQKYDWDDIAYNFLIGGDDSIYIGRGWFYQGAHSRIFNRNSICIAFIGNFWKESPPQRSLIAAQRLIEEGVKMGYLAKDYRLYGHRQLIDTISPGNRLYEIIQNWNHWSDEVIPP